MAVQDKARLRSRLVGLYPTVAGFTTERLDALAAKLTATDESSDEDIDAELTTINDSGFYTFEQIKKEDDQNRNRVNNPKKVETTKPPTTPPAADTDSVIAEMQKQMTELANKLAEKDAQDARQALHNRFKSDERLKKVPKSWVNNNLPLTEEDFETAVTAVTEEFQAFATEHKLEAISNDTPPAAAGGPKGGEAKQVSKEDADTLAKALLG